MAERINAVKTSFFGKGAIRLLGPELQKMGIRRALLVTDRFLYDSGAAARVGQVLSDAGVEYAVYYNVQPNPTVQVVNDCIAAARTLQVQLLVALGGGSAIDTAKAASIVLACGGSVKDYEGENKSSKPGLPIVAVNTTAGTGSECTSFYIVTDPVRHSKMAMVDPNCMVSIAVNDTDFMSSMPPKLTAATGMDALTHAIEGYTTKAAWEMTDMFHLEAIKLISAHLRDAVKGTKEGREGMALGQYIAGMGFSNVGLGIAHSMAHTLGAVYDTPHGVACALLTPPVMAFNAIAAPERLAEVGHILGVPRDPNKTVYEQAYQAAEAFRALMQQLDLPLTLTELGTRGLARPAIMEADLDTLTADAMLARGMRGRNPRVNGERDIRALYASEL